MSKNKSNNVYNKLGLFFFTGTVGFSCLWAGYFLIFKNTIDLGEYKNQNQVQVNQTEEPIVKKESKAWISTKQWIAYGSKIYKAQCALCHGSTGLGDGTPGLIPPPRNLVEGKWKNGGSSKALFSTLQKGMEGTSMTSFKHLPKEDRWALVHYIRSITKNKVPDDEQELEEFAIKAL